VHEAVYPKNWSNVIGLFVNADINETSTPMISVPESLFITVKRVLKLHPSWNDLPRQLKSEFSLLAAFIARVRLGIDTFEKDKKNVFDRAEYLYIRYFPEKCVNGYTLVRRRSKFCQRVRRI
jgi:hypothetical protein